MYEHTLDPFLFVKPFKPENDGSWIDEAYWQLGYYEFTKINEITNEHGNTHSIEHYIANPKVHSTMIRDILREHLVNEGCTRETIDEAFQAAQIKFEESTLGNVAEDLKAKLEELELDDEDSIKSLVAAGESLYKFVKAYGGQL